MVLDDLMTLGHVRKRCFTPVFHVLDGEIGSDMEKFVSHMAALRRAKSTIGSYRLYLSDFRRQAQLRDGIAGLKTWSSGFGHCRSPVLRHRLGQEHYNNHHAED